MKNLRKVKKALDKGLSVTETGELTGSSLSGVNRYRHYLRALLPSGNRPP